MHRTEVNQTIAKSGEHKPLIFTFAPLLWGSKPINVKFLRFLCLFVVRLSFFYCAFDVNTIQQKNEEFFAV